MKMKRKFLCGLMALMMLACTAVVSCGDPETSSTDDTSISQSSVEEGSSDVGDPSDPADSSTDSGENETVNQFIFEAEYTDLSGIEGAGFSNAMGNTATITYDKFNAEASNDYFVGYLYKKGCTLTFNIYSDKAVEGVKLELRASAEGGLTSINSSEMVVAVNGTQISYRDMSFDGVKSSFFSMTDDGVRAFSDYTLSKTINLQAGNNVITFTNISEITLGGTATARFPLMDCIKLTTPTESDAVLSMEPNADSVAYIDYLENM